MATAYLYAWLNRARIWNERGITIARLGPVALTFGVIWFLAAPLITWIVATLYIPIMGPSLQGDVVWVAAGLSTALLVVSLVAHTASHVGAAHLTKSVMPNSISVGPFGDAAQEWLPAPTPWREALVALAEPFANLFLAGLSFLVWDRQPHPVLNVSLFLIMFVNLALALINLAPGFPLDGGRLTRAIVWALLADPVTATRSVLWSGRLLLAALLVWGIWLYLQPARFSSEAALGTILVADGLGLESTRRVAWPSVMSTITRRTVTPAVFARALAAIGAVLVLLAPPAVLLPTLHGQRAPGFAVAVEPMIDLPAAYRNEPDGHFVLTTVISQTPIAVGQWIYAHHHPAIELVPPETIVPPGISPQELVQHTHTLLDDSTLVATIVALGLAGYETTITGDGAEVLEVLQDSPANGVLITGDRIVAANGEPVTTANELVTLVRQLQPGNTVELLIERDDERLGFTLSVMAPTSPGEPPRLGIVLRTVGERAELPFPIQVNPQKIVGGPSAGLMFTLTIYNLLTPEDLTKGYQIAGTGTVNLDGEVGRIGSVVQKVAAAEQAGAAYFLVPLTNAPAAHQGTDRIEIVEVATVQEAIEFLRNLPPPSGSAASLRSECTQSAPGCQLDQSSPREPELAGVSDLSAPGQ
jgi:Lon-like protease